MLSVAVIICLGGQNDIHQLRLELFFFVWVALVVPIGTVTLCGVSLVCIENWGVDSQWSFEVCRFCFFLVVITIVLHQSVGMSTGTGVMIPLRTSSQRACFTGSLKWKGTGIGLCLALGVAPSFRCICYLNKDFPINLELSKLLGSHLQVELGKLSCWCLHICCLRGSLFGLFKNA